MLNKDEENVVLKGKIMLFMGSLWVLFFAFIIFVLPSIGESDKEIDGFMGFKLQEVINEDNYIHLYGLNSPNENSKSRNAFIPSKKEYIVEMNNYLPDVTLEIGTYGIDNAIDKITLNAKFVNSENCTRAFEKTIKHIYEKYNFHELSFAGILYDITDKNERKIKFENQCSEINLLKDYSFSIYFSSEEENKKIRDKIRNEKKEKLGKEENKNIESIFNNIINKDNSGNE